MKMLMSIALTLGAVFVPRPAFAVTPCDARDLVIVELDFVRGHEVMKINGDLVKPGQAFDEFAKNCARKTVILANRRTKLDQIFDIRLFIGKIGSPGGPRDFFWFMTGDNTRAMTYMATFAVVRFTKDKSELLKLIENPPQESNWL